MSFCWCSHSSYRSVQKRMSTHDKGRRRIWVNRSVLLIALAGGNQADHDIDERRLADLKLLP